MKTLSCMLGLELGPPRCDPGLEYRGAGEGGSREELCEDAVVYVGASTRPAKL